MDTCNIYHKTITFTALIYGLLFTVMACNNDTNNTHEGKEMLKIVTTTGMIKDAVVNIAQDKVSVTALMGPGVDPHLYKATQSDLKNLTQADMVLYNGLYLEGKLEDILKN